MELSTNDVILLEDGAAGDVRFVLSLDGTGERSLHPYASWISSSLLRINGDPLPTLYVRSEGVAAGHETPINHDATAVTVHSGTGRVSYELEFSLSAGVGSTNWTGDWHANASSQTSLSVESLTPGIQLKLWSELTPADILNNSVTWSKTTTDGSDLVVGQFTPNWGLTLFEAADFLGVDYFNWFNLVRNDHVALTEQNLSRISEDGATMVPATTLRLDGTVEPYFDPPPGGWYYQGARPGNPVRDNFPTYLDETTLVPLGSFLRKVGTTITPVEDETYRELLTNDTSSSVTILSGSEELVTIDPHSMAFIDRPGGAPGVQFTTSLAGVDADNPNGRKETSYNFSSTAHRWNVDGGNVFRDNLVDPGGGTISLLGAVEPGGYTQEEVGSFTAAGVEIVTITLPGDYNFDNVVDAADYVVWRKNGGTQEQYNEWRGNFGRGSSVTLPGDFHGDGNVDAADYVVWRKNNGTQDDYDTWRAHFGQSAGNGSLSNGSVPEPRSMSLLLLATALGSLKRRFASRVPSDEKRGEERRLAIGSLSVMRDAVRIAIYRLGRAASTVSFRPTALRTADELFQSQ